MLIALSLFSFSTVCFADAAAPGPGVMGNILMLGGFLLIFYFMLIRPQSKRAKEHQALVSSIAKDDEVIVNGGILGRVTRVTEQFLVVAIADGVEMKVQKQAVSASLPKGTMKSI
ncbi:MAG: preprotein translocase subunit YajC [Candidatus Berkiella sp.]